MKHSLALLGLLAGAFAGPVALRADELLPADRSIEQAVDHYIDAALKENGVKPASPADDAELLRRSTLDLNGRIPTPAEVRDYLASPDPEKRLKLVERLMASPAYARHQANELETLFSLGLDGQGGGKKGRNAGSLRDYLRAATAENRPWDRIFRELIVADESDPKLKGASDFIRPRMKDLDRLTTDVSSLFFGVNIGCARCHNHPLVPDWKQDHFFGMKSFFARTVEAGNFVGEKGFGVVKFTPNKGTEKPAKVMFLTGKVLDDPTIHEPTNDELRKDRERLEVGKKGDKAPAAPVVSMRAQLVDLALSSGQRDFFARSAVNRVWHRLFGQGLVNPLDQMHSENPPSHPELLDWLARDFVEHGYDLRRLTRGLALSRAYARSSRWDGEQPAPPRLFAVAPVRPLTPTQMAVSLKLASLDPDSLPAPGPALEKRLEQLEQEAAGLAGLFPQPGDDFQVGVAEALLFSNGDKLFKECLDGSKGRLVNRLEEEKDLDKRVRLAVQAVLSRPARNEEAAALTDYLHKRMDRPTAACQQIVWALLTSPEFRFNH
jgi:hypothetical protein